MKLYRVENLSKGNGLWYHINQEYAGTIITLDLTNKALPADNQAFYNNLAQAIINAYKAGEIE